jgi:hypothetical protein
MQIGGRVMWWDSKGHINYGQVQAINVLADVCF